MLHGRVFAVVSAFAMSVSSILISRSSNKQCTSLSSPTTSPYLLWTRCLDFRRCFIQCYQDMGCSGFWFFPENGLCLGHPAGYYTSGSANTGQFYDLCRRKACPLSRGYVKLEDSGLCVKVHHEIKTWGKGRSICLAEGGDLVVLNTKLKYHSLHNYIFKLNFKWRSVGRRAWIGMRRDGGHDYKWVGRQPFWVTWVPGDPSYGAEKCCQIFMSGISDVRCHNPRYFICEIHDTA